MSENKSGLNRRDFMKIGAAGAAAITLGDSSVLAATPKRGGTVTCGMAFLIQYPDPHQYIGQWAIQAKAMSWEGLLTPTSLAERARIAKTKGPDAVPVVQPMLAEAYEVDKEAKRYVFHLKKGVKFHNGKELDSGDVKWSWERIKDPRTRAGARLSLGQFLEGIETPDKYTIIANLSRSYASFLAANTYGYSPILPKDCIPAGARWGQTPDSPKEVAPPGTGPFIMTRHQQNNEAQFEAFKDYRVKGLPYLDKVIYKVVSEFQPRTMALRAGNLDYIYSADPDWLNKVLAGKFDKLNQYLTLKDEKLVLFPTPGAVAVTIYLNSHEGKTSPFKDVRVRQAFNYSIDRAKICKTMFGQLATPTAQFANPAISFWGFKDIVPPQPDIEKAKKLLAEAGYANGLDVELHATPEWGRNDVMAQIVQQMAGEAGFRVKITQEVGMQYYGHLREYSYQALIYTFEGSLDPMLGGGYGAFHTDPTDPWKGYSPSLGLKDPEMDKLFDDAISGTDNKKRKAAYKKAIQRINEQVYVIPLYRSIEANAWSTKLQNFDPLKYFYPEEAFREAWLQG
jgi:peptide/nickel transport system substrate-binding protein